MFEKRGWFYPYWGKLISRHLTRTTKDGRDRDRTDEGCGSVEVRSTGHTEEFLNINRQYNEKICKGQ